MLKPLQPNTQTPYGQFDGYDNIVTTMKGGEVGTIVAMALGAATDKSSKDADGSDGYVGDPARRPAITTLLASGSRPLMLLDEGTAGYGTLFGSVIGGSVGQVVAGAALGPHSAYASGKITCWASTGLYAVTLDAVDTTPSNGLVPTNTALAIGDAIYATAGGVITPTAAKSFESVLKLGRFIEFTTNRSLVTTPQYLTAALNSPVGQVTSLAQLAMTEAVIHFAPPGN